LVVGKGIRVEIVAEDTSNPTIHNDRLQQAGQFFIETSFEYLGYCPLGSMQIGH